MSFIVFCKRNLAFARLGVMSNLEYRMNFIADAVLQPVINAVVELFLWWSIFTISGMSSVGGFGMDSYLSYALWAAFMARISISWMYEFRMVEEVESGSLSAVLLRPMGFSEYYLSQLLGYKAATMLFSLLIPMGLIYFLALPTDFSRVPAALGLVFLYLVFIHLTGFVIATFGFYMTKVSSLSVAKNLALFVLSGEMVPLDLMPVFFQKILLNLPFSSGVYVPVGYVTGRFGTDLLWHAYVVVLAWIVVLGGLSHLFWKRALRSYVGTGA